MGLFQFLKHELSPNLLTLLSHPEAKLSEGVNSLIVQHPRPLDVTLYASDFAVCLAMLDTGFLLIHDGNCPPVCYLSGETLEQVARGNAAIRRAKDEGIK